MPPSRPGYRGISRLDQLVVMVLTASQGVMCTNGPQGVLL